MKKPALPRKNGEKEMLFKKRQKIIVKKEIVPAEKIDPMRKPKTFKQTRFDRFDIPGETSKSIRKILLLILALFGVWFIIECVKSWNIFQ